MRTFDVPGPLGVRIESAVGAVAVTSTDERTAHVDVQALRDDDATRDAVENTLVDLRPKGEGHELVVEVPKKSFSFFGRDPKIRIEVRVPHGSDVTVRTASADVALDGRFGRVHGTTASGDLRVTEAEWVRLHTASGDIVADEVHGDADFKTASGDVRSTHVGGRLTAGVVSGDLTVDRADGGGSAGAVSGTIELGSVGGGDLSVNSVSGDVTVGVPEGTSVHVDVATVTGDLRSDVELRDEPSGGTGGPLLSIRGKTVSGDVRLRRVGPARI